MHKAFIDLISLAQNYKYKIDIFFIANIKNKTQNYSDYSDSSVDAEFLSEENYNRIVNSLKNQGFCVKCYYDEEDFITDCAKHDYFKTSAKQIVVINSAQKGTLIGRKSLIPSFCDLFNFWYAGSNPYICSLARDKFKSSCLLENLGISCAKSYLYNNKTGWLLGQKPPCGSKVIAKLNYEASSISLTEENCFIYKSEKDDFIYSLAQKYKQSIIVQEFIDGYEIEFPFIKTNQSLATLPVSVAYNTDGKMGTDFLTYELRKNREYHFYDYRQINNEISSLLLECSKKVIDSLNLDGLCRIDFRITDNNEYYVTDIATNPGYTEITSVRFAFSTLGFDYNQLLLILVGAIIQKYKENNIDEI